MNGNELLCKGQLIAFMEDYQSGIGTVVIKDSATGALEHIFCPSEPMDRELLVAFGSKVLGQVIYFSIDSNGILDGFTPVRDAEEEMIRVYDETHTKH